MVNNLSFENELKRVGIMILKNLYLKILRVVKI